MLTTDGHRTHTRDLWRQSRCAGALWGRAGETETVIPHMDFDMTSFNEDGWIVSRMQSFIIDLRKDIALSLSMEEIEFSRNKGQDMHTYHVHF